MRSAADWSSGAMVVSHTKVTDHYFGLVGKPERFRDLSELVELVIFDQAAVSDGSCCSAIENRTFRSCHPSSASRPHVEGVKALTGDRTFDRH